MDEITRTTVYTDGACLGNPGPGGWAWAVPGGRWRSGAAGLTTNQRMEITAALEAGANEYVMKPFTKDILLEKLQLVGVHP